MDRVVIFGVGSSIVPDVQESLGRAGVAAAAGVRNMECRDWCLEGLAVVEPSGLTAELLALPFLAPFFTPANRQKVVRQAVGAGFRAGYSLVDPTSPCARSLVHGEGLYVNSGCTVGAAGELGDWVFLNRGASIGHHVRFGDFVSVGPGAVVAAFAALGRGCVIGAGAVVLPEVEVGSNSVVGAGSVVTRDVPANCLAIGSPARIVKSGIAGYHDLSVE